MRSAGAFAMLEALLWEPGGGYFLLERHLGRLQRSAAHFGRPLDLHRVRAALDDHAGAAPAAGALAHKVRLSVPARGEPQVDALPLGERSVVRAALAAAPVDPSDERLAHKTSRRELYTGALASHPGADDVILWNTRGELTETCSGNLVLSLDGRRLTPEAGAGLLPGTYRAELLEQGLIEEARLLLDDLERASALTFINSVRRALPIVLLPRDGAGRSRG